MKTIKRSVLAIAAIALLAPALPSCKKTVTPKKLDGEWGMTSGKVVSSETYSNGDTETSTTTYDGATQSTLVSENGVPEAADAPTPYTMTISFDKKAGTYEQVTVSTYTYTNEGMATYKKDANGMPTDEKYLDQQVTVVSTSTEKGLFTVTGGTGEIEKNTQFVLRGNDTESNVSNTYKYFEGSTSVSATGRYTYGWNGEEELQTSKSEIIVETGHNSYDGTIYTVDELKKGVMEVSGSSASTTTIGANTTKETTEFNWTLTEQ